MEYATQRSSDNMKQEAKCLLTVLIAWTHAGVLFIKFVGSSSKTLFSSPKSVAKIAHFMYNFNCTIYPLHHGIGQWLLSHFLLLWFSWYLDSGWEGLVSQLEWLLNCYESHYQVLALLLNFWISSSECPPKVDPPTILIRSIQRFWHVILILG